MASVSLRSTELPVEAHLGAPWREHRRDDASCLPALQEITRRHRRSCRGASTIFKLICSEFCKLRRPDLI